jgi:hypothetical protein
MKMPKELSYLDIGEIEDEDDNTVLSFPTATPNDEFGEKLCKAFNSFDDLLDAARNAADFLASEYAQVSDPENRAGWSGDPAAFENYRSLRAAIDKAED